jgi:hypothetical protein
MEWYLWLIGLVLAIGFFAAVEGLALRHPDRQWTLSKCMAVLGARFPFSIWICGIFSGALAFHFWGHYCMIG